METTEIINVISRGEDRRQQFKADMTNADAFSAEIVAFSNTACGSILIGVNDDGSVRGLSGADLARLNQLVSNAASQNVRPAVNTLTDNVPHPNGTVMVVSIADGISKPYMDKNGTILVNNGSDKRRSTFCAVSVNAKLDRSLTSRASALEALKSKQAKSRCMGSFAMFI